MFAALIFDVDGTLAETEEAHRTAFNETFRDYGLGWEWDRETYRQLLQTTGGKERMRAYAHSVGLDPSGLPIAEIHDVKTAKYGALLKQGGVPLRPGIESLIRDAKDKGLRLAVATTTNLPNVDCLIEATLGCKSSEVFEVIAAGDMVARKKPAPDVYQLALKGLGVPGRACLAFEDSRNGLVSAHAAGVPCLVCPSWYNSRDDFSEARVLINSYEKLRGVEALGALFETA